MLASAGGRVLVLREGAEFGFSRTARLAMVVLASVASVLPVVGAGAPTANP